jgi:hypothetical protein
MDVWEGEDGTERTIRLLNFNDDPNKYYINGTDNRYWIPLKIVFKGEGTIDNPLIFDVYMNDIFVSSQLFDNIVWLGDYAVGLQKNGDGTDLPKFDNIKISELELLTSLENTNYDNRFYFNSKDASIHMKEECRNAYYELYTITGVKIRKERITGPQTFLPVNSLTQGAYLLRVINENDQSQTIRIIFK